MSPTSDITEPMSETRPPTPLLLISVVLGFPILIYNESFARCVNAILQQNVIGSSHIFMIMGYFTYMPLVWRLRGGVVSVLNLVPARGRVKLRIAILLSAVPVVTVVSVAEYDFRLALDLSWNPHMTLRRFHFLGTLVIVYKGHLIRDVVWILEKLRNSKLKRLVYLSNLGDRSNIAK